jgi:hypothetical protein
MRYKKRAAVCQSEYCTDVTGNKHELVIVRRRSNTVELRTVIKRAPYSSNKNEAVTADKNAAVCAMRRLLIPTRYEKQLYSNCKSECSCESQ